MLFCAEKVRAEYLFPAPDVTESEAGPEFTVAALDALVRMKLTSFRLKDKVHLLDLLDVGLIDETWCDRFPPALAHDWGNCWRLGTVNFDIRRTYKAVQPTAGIACDSVRCRSPAAADLGRYAKTASFTSGPAP